MSDTFRTTVFNKYRRTCSVCGKEFIIPSSDYLFKFGSVYQCGYNCHQKEDANRESTKKKRHLTTRGY